jgi:hypothetical protein
MSDCAFLDPCRVILGRSSRSRRRGAPTPATMTALSGPIHTRHLGGACALGASMPFSAVALDFVSQSGAP